MRRTRLVEFLSQMGRLWAVLVVGLLPALSWASSQITILQHDGSPYGEADPAARARVARKFFETHADAYDFLVVLPTFDVNLGQDIAGRHLFVRNAVQGIGVPLFDGGAEYGSLARLKGYVDLRGLSPDSQGSTVESVSALLAHEVLHQWSGRVAYLDPETQVHRMDLVGREGSHWSFFLDSEASVLYGSDWVQASSGTFAAVHSRARYSALDLYLMGLMGPEEVGPLTLLSPGQDVSQVATDLPPPDGTSIEASARVLSISDVVGAEGPRLPSVESSQRAFRAAFVVLTPPGQQATPQQVAFVEGLRRSFSNSFFFLTRGRAVFETELVENSSPPGTTAPSLQRGLDFLMDRQDAAGSWTGSNGTRWRDTQLALDALTLSGVTPRITASLELGGDFLAATIGTGVDDSSRKVLGLIAARETPQVLQPALATLIAQLGAPGDGVGLASGFSPTVIDSVLAARALHEAGTMGSQLSALTEFVLARQGGDGGWPLVTGGPGNVGVTALAMDLLARLPRSPATYSAASRGGAFFESRRHQGGLYGDEHPSVMATAQVILALHSWSRLPSAEAVALAGTLMARQGNDGGWESSVPTSAWVIQAIRRVRTPNLSLSPLDVTLSATTVVEGEGVLATVSVHNFGGTRVEDAQVQAFDANGLPLGTPKILSGIEAGGTGTVVLTVDTTGHAGDSQFFVVADAPQLVDESREDDNRVSVPLSIAPAPVLPDLTVVVGSLTTVPDVIGRLPVNLSASATLKNLGIANVDSVEVALVVQGTAIATTMISLAGQSSVPITLTGSVTHVSAAAAVSLVVDPRNLFAEANEGNNTDVRQVPVTPSLDLGVINLAVSPLQVQQGQDASISFRVANAGTVDAAGTTIQISIETSTGTQIAVLPSHVMTVPSGGAVQRGVSWRANLAGSLVVRVRALAGPQLPVDGNPADNVATAGLIVEPSTLANLDVPLDGLSLSPQRPLQGRQATATVVVRNSGASQAGPFFVDFHLGTVGGADSRFSRVEVASVAPGGSHSVSAPFAVESSEQAAVRVELDADEQIPEADEIDNRVVQFFSPVPFADLVIVDADIQPNPLFPREGMDAPVTVSVLNAGGQDAQGGVLDLYLGAPGTTGTLIGSQLLTMVAAGARAEVTIPWNTAQLTGEQYLTAAVNASRSVTESRHDNNHATRKIHVQNAALALSNPFFSPNKDGVKDTTNLSYRLAEAAEVKVEIRDESGGIVRTIEVGAALIGIATWDGRDANGLSVRDGAYQLAVRAKAASGSLTDIGTMVAVVDTNRSLLEAVSRPEYLVNTSLKFDYTSPGTSLDARTGGLAIAPDDSGTYFVGQRLSNPETRCSFYFQPLEGGKPQRISSEWDCVARGVSDVFPTPDGLSLIFTAWAYGCASEVSYCKDIRLFDLVTHEERVVATSIPGRMVASLGFSNERVQFSLDGRQVVFQSLSKFAFDETRRLVEVIDLTGENRRILLDDSTYGPKSIASEVALSPDGNRLAVLLDRKFNDPTLSDVVVMVEMEQGNHKILSPYASDARGVGGIRLNSLLAWVSNEEISFADSDAGILAVHRDTGKHRTLFRPGNGDGGAPLFWSQPLAAAGDGTTLYLERKSASGTPQIWAVPVSGGTARPVVSFDSSSNVQWIEDVRLSPRGSVLGVTYQSYVSHDRHRVVSSLDNLGVRLVATRKSGMPFLTIQGTAVDKNFESYEVAIRRMPEGSSVVIGRSTQSVLNGTLAEWAPPAPGNYEVVLTARDKAGNIKTRKTQASWASTPLLANLWREPEFISPNGDGVQEVSMLHYTTTAPLTSRFEFVSSEGDVVRNLSMTHSEAGDYSLAWDGRDDVGTYVADGVYTARAEGSSLSFIVDTTPPQLRLSFSDDVPDGASPPEVPPVFTRGFVTAVTQLEGTQVSVPVVFLQSSWRAEDPHLSRWAFEQRAALSSDDFTTVASGESSATTGRWWRLPPVRGQALRLRAWDKAGNQSDLPPRLIPERLFVTALGDASLVDVDKGGLVFEGRQIPRLDLLAPLVDALGRSQVFAFEPRHYAFALDHTSDSPLVSYAIEYTHRLSGVVRRDTQNVGTLGESVVVWDARAVPMGPYTVTVEATAADGQTFRASVAFETKLSSLAVCTAYENSQESSKVSLTILPAALPLLEPGATVAFFAPAAQQPEQTYSFASAKPLFNPDGSTVLAVQLDTSSLTSCEYRAVFRGRSVLGQRLDSEELVNICGAFLKDSSVTGTQVALSLAENFRRPISSMEVYLQADGSSTWGKMGALGPFNGVAPLLTLAGNTPLACTAQKIRVVTRFADGGAPVDSSSRSTSTCTEATLKVPCTQVSVASVVRLGERAAACITQDPVYSVTLKASAEGGAKIEELAAWVKPHSSSAVAPVLLSPFTPAAKVEVTGTFSTEGMPAGRYNVLATAKDSRGATARDVHESVSALVDRQPPVTRLDSPAAQALVCPVPTRDAAGRLRPMIEVTGSIEDNLLEGYAVLMGPAGEPLTQRASQFFALPKERVVSGPLAKVDVGGLPSGDYEMRLSAWEASGSSHCSPSTTFRFLAGVEIEQFTADRDFVAPDQGGTTLHAALTESAQVKVTVARLNGSVEGEGLGAIFEGTLSQGLSDIEWDGRGPAGSALLDGDYLLRLTALNSCGAESTKTLRLRVDGQMPVARVDAPTANSSVKGTVMVLGEARDTNFRDYELSIGEGLSPTTFTVVRTSRVPATESLGAVDTARLPPGPHTLRLVVRDTAGHSSTALVTVDVESRGVLGGFSLSNVVVSPNGDGVHDSTQASFRLLTPATVRMEVVDSGDQVVRIPLASSARGTGEHTVLLEGSGLQLLPDGPYRVRMVASAGSVVEEAEAPLALDSELPLVELATPLAGTFVRGTVDVVGTIHDEHLIEWSVVHGAPSGSTLVASGLAPVDGKILALNGLVEGSHSLTVRATDAAGNTREQVVSFAVDVSRPRVAFTSPGEGAFLTGLNGLVPITVDVEESHLRRLTLEALSPGGPASRMLASWSEVPGDGIVLRWDVGEEEDGDVTLVLKAEDLAGNTAESQIAVTLDSTQPVAHILSSRDGTAPTEWKVTGTATDTHLYEYSVALANGPPSSSSRYVILVNGKTSVISGALATLSAAPADGHYSLRLRVTDRAGNEAEEFADLIIDETPPLAPTGLVVEVRQPRSVALSWSASSDSDLAGYRVLRGKGGDSLTPLGTGLITGTTYLDEALQPSEYRYAVVAVDTASLQSQPSSEVAVDMAPPVVAIHSPADGAIVAGKLEVRGQAFSRMDFHEYRLSVGAGASPTVFVQVARGSAPTVAGWLGTWDASMLPHGSQQTLRLEAEDTAGNVSETRVVVQVDNVAPSAPLLVSAVATGTTADVQWAANPETDLAGYLLFANGALANAPEGVSPGDFSVYMLSAETLRYIDAGLPDGTTTYQLYAVDTVGNLSDPSAVRTVSVETRAPVARVASPTHLSRVAGRVMAWAETADLDVARVQWEIRPAGQATFLSAGTAATQFPYSVMLDPSQFTASVLELRAVATDASGNVDPAPSSIFIFHAPELAPPGVVARTDGNAVNLSWLDGNGAGQVLGFDVRRAGTSILPVPPRPVAVASASSTAVGTSPSAAYDSNVSTAWRPGASLPQIWEMDFPSPQPLETVTLKLSANLTVRVFVKMLGAWVPVGPEVLATSSELTVALPQVLAAEGVRVQLVRTTSSSIHLAEVSAGLARLTTAHAIVDPNRTMGVHPYQVSAVSNWGQRADGTGQARVYQPSLRFPSQTHVATQTTRLEGYGAEAGAAVTLLRGGASVAEVHADAAGVFFVDVPLEMGSNVFSAVAQDAAGNRSMVSETVSVVRVALPTAAILLSPAQVMGADVSMAFSVAGELSDVGSLEVWRSSGEGDAERVASLSVETRAHTDPRVRNGTYSYTVVAVSLDGFLGTPSNAVSATVDVPLLAPPEGLVITAPASGSALELRWTYSSNGAERFRVERASAQSGPFEMISEDSRLSGPPSYLDRGLTNGTRYYYRVMAIDAAGNRSAPSSVASGAPVDTQVPEAPRLLQPTVPGAPIVVSEMVTRVQGTAEPLSLVSLYRGATLVGRTQASPIRLRLEDVPLSLSRRGTPSLSPDGQRVAYVYLSGSPSRGVAVEHLETGTVVSATLEGVSFQGTPVFSPDGTRVVAEGTSSEGTQIYIMGIASAVLQPVLEAYSGEDASPVWAPDGSRLVVRRLDETGYGSLRIFDLATGAQHALPSQESEDFLSALWLPDGRRLVAVVVDSQGIHHLRRFDTVDNSFVDLFSAESILTRLALSPTGREVAVPFYDADYQSMALTLVSVEGGPNLGRRMPDAEPADMPVFTSGGAFLVYPQGAYLYRQAIDGGTRERMGTMSSRLLMGSGEQLVAASGSTSPRVSKVQFVGSFAFDDIFLEAGDNFLSAVAEDAAGTRSDFSPSIEVRFEPDAVADLSVAAVLQPSLPMATDVAYAVVTLSNEGTAMAEAPLVAVTVVTKDGALRPSPLTRLSQPLAPGGSAIVLVPVDVNGLSGPQQLNVVVDPGQEILELHRDNNALVVPFLVAETSEPIISVVLDGTSVQVNGQRTATVTLANPGAPLFGEVHVDLIGADGHLVLPLGTSEVIAPLPSGEVRTFTRVVAVGTLLAGDYGVRASLWRNGSLVADDAVALEVLPERTANVSVSMSRSRYRTGEKAEVNSQVTSSSRNSFLNGAVSVVTLRNTDGSFLAQWSSALPMLLSGQSETRITEIETGVLVPGAYVVTSEVHLGTEVLAQAQASFTMEGRPVLVGLLSIAGHPGAQPVFRMGEQATVDVFLENRGTASEGEGVVRLVSTRPDGTLQTISTWPLSMLPPGGQWTRLSQFSTAGWPLGLHGLVLLVERPVDGTEVLARLTLQVLDGGAPRLTLLNLTDGMYVGERVSARIRALDDASGVASVRVNGSGVTTVLASPVSGNALDGIWGADVLLPTEGPHSLVFSAADLGGNDGRILASLDNPVSITVIRDTQGPVLTVSGVPGAVPVHGPVVPVFSAADPHLASVDATLNGVTIASGTPVSTDGAYELEVSARDRAGNTVQALHRFTIDSLPPRIVLGGVQDGAFVRQDITPTLEVTDSHLDTTSVTATLDGQPFTLGTSISDEAAHTLLARARDFAANVTESQITFTLDKTPPAIQVSGVSDGASAESFTIQFMATDANLDANSLRATMDGTPFLSGGDVNTEGAHVLQVQVSDLAGNSTIKLVSFTVVTVVATDPLMPSFTYAVCSVQDTVVFGNAQVVGPSMGDKASVAANSLAYVGQFSFVSGDLVGGYSAVVEEGTLAGSLYYGEGYAIGDFATVLGGVHAITPSPTPCYCGYDVLTKLEQASLENDNTRLAAFPGSSAWWVNGSFELNGAQVVLPSGRFHADHLQLTGGATLSAAPGANVLIFVAHDVVVQDGSTLGSSPGAAHPLTLVMGAHDVDGDLVEIDNADDASLRLYAPRANILLSGDTTLYGALMGKTVELSGAQRVVLKPGPQVSPPPLFCE
ncbi:CARDB domain-containing protein [Myxococcus sp. CA039A]|uniref:CARDB domain-containing protein n=1 Tax=Myxococcus sp. CA039A TaxID=2741737 RepID=UPI00157B99D2|nr:CARDB domain-containing protein [Myxococcus sp. CA039A]NTX54914.1 hypothetical protein [Myxococcus sp. CA039A]